jgi:DNA-binding MarR family transcriptional regulator
MVESNEKYYAQHLYIVSAVFPVKLTDKEIQVLSLFMDKGNFFKSTRTYVKNRLNLSAASLSNYIKILVEKGYIKKSNDDMYELHDLIKLKNGRIEYNFVLQKSE